MINYSRKKKNNLNNKFTKREKCLLILESIWA